MESCIITKRTESTPFIDAWNDYYMFASRINDFFLNSNEVLDDSSDDIFDVQHPGFPPTFLLHIMHIDAHVAKSKESGILGILINKRRWCMGK